MPIRYIKAQKEFEELNYSTADACNSAFHFDYKDILTAPNKQSLAKDEPSVYKGRFVQFITRNTVDKKKEKNVSDIAIKRYKTTSSSKELARDLEFLSCPGNYHPNFIRFVGHCIDDVSFAPESITYVPFL